MRKGNKVKTHIINQNETIRVIKSYLKMKLIGEIKRRIIILNKK